MLVSTLLRAALCGQSCSCRQGVCRAVPGAAGGRAAVRGGGDPAPLVTALTVVTHFPVSAPLPLPPSRSPPSAGPRASRENGERGAGRVNAERFLPCGVNTTECMFAFICISKHILKAPRLESSVFYSVFL